ncbi:WEB family protein At3g02930, chloroplastic [Arachis duranensis]|uniref:WEB family protein At3g02930, chloroplastic n=1 Tax=Arachis duranensis TaxID=130453 RepID=A0A6P4DHJ1_ARADU|nr:WEB family protein At3g02930, chloroplastic [Arachis duranensis]
MASKSSLSETPNKGTPATPKKAASATPKKAPSTTPGKAASATSNKASPATPRVSKLSKGVPKSEAESPSPLQASRLSAERSPRTVNLKPNFERKSPRPVTTPPDKLQPRAAKGSELQTQLNHAQEELKKAKDMLVQAEKEKAKALDQLKEAQKLAEEANEKLREALVAQKQVEEDCEIEKFRAVELEQAGIEAQKKEEEWKKELENVRSQHAVDVASLLSTTQELQRVKQELAMTCDAKNQALIHADEATKLAEVQAEKADNLSAELSYLKALLDSKLETEASENQIVLKLKTEIKVLKEKIEMEAKGYNEKLTEKENYIEQLNVELEAAKMAESYAHSMLEEWKNKVEKLEMRVEEANKLERSASASLDSMTKQLEGNNDLLHDAESEITSSKEKVALLEMTIGRQKGDLEDSERRLLVAKEEILEMSKKVKSLESELKNVKEEKAQALSKEKLAESSVQILLEEKNKLINELEICRDEEEKSKMAMESLASALHEVTAEARDAKEKLLANQAEHKSYGLQVEDLKAVLKATNEKYESMLDDARREIDDLTFRIENLKGDNESSKAEWEKRENHLSNCLKQTKEENTSLGKEIDRLLHLLKKTEEESSAKMEEEAQLKENLKEVEAEVIHLQESLKEAQADSMKLKESLLDKENEFQNVFQENEELRARELESIQKVQELSKLLEEATIRKDSKDNEDLSESEKDYDLLPKVVEFSEENGHGHGGDDVSKENKSESPKPENVNGEVKQGKDDSVKVEFKMWESCQIEKKELSSGKELDPEPFDSFGEEVVDSKNIGVNAATSVENKSDGESQNESSPSKEQQFKKKKRSPLGKLGSLFKKKSGSK